MELSITPKQIQYVKNLISDIFAIEEIKQEGKNPVFQLYPRFDLKRSRKIIRERLKITGYKFTLEEKEDLFYLEITGFAGRRVPALNIILFVLTLLTVYIVPVFYKSSYKLLVPILNGPPEIIARFLSQHNHTDFIFQNISAVWGMTKHELSQGTGLVFTVALISILFVHEMAHYIASRRREIITSWPYFIPAPNIIGTFGAVIKSISPFRNRRDLIEVGASGPIAGWIVAIGWLWYGLSISSVLPPNQLLPFEGFSMEGESILVKFMVTNLIGNAPAGYFYQFSEAAFAGWVGLLITAINMLPIGQLDGGHVIYGLAKGKKQFILGIISVAGLLFLGYFSPIWWFFAAFGLIFGIKHPRTMNDFEKLPRFALWMGIAAVLILILSFTPIPFRA